MKRSEWEKISAARKVLHLGETASLSKIKGAFRRMCKKNHPDILVQGKKEEICSMQEINEAYEVLLRYCTDFHFPLTPQASGQPMEEEDWWMDRFGDDPLWGKKRDG